MLRQRRNIQHHPERTRDGDSGSEDGEDPARRDIEVLATGNPGCMFQFKYGAQKLGMKLEVVHPVELLARASADL